MFWRQVQVKPLSDWIISTAQLLDPLIKSSLVCGLLINHLKSAAPPPPLTSLPATLSRSGDSHPRLIQDSGLQPPAIPTISPQQTIYSSPETLKSGEQHRLPEAHQYPATSISPAIRPSAAT